MSPRGRRGRHVLANGLLYATVAVFFVPTLWIVLTAIRPDVEVNARPPVWVPQEITFSAFAAILGTEHASQSVPIFDYLRNSLSTALASTVAALTLGTLAGYGFARLRFRGRSALFLVMLLARAVPGIALSLPLFVLFARIGIVDSVVGLGLAYTAMNVPFTAWLMDGFFREVPPELGEAARIDGCSWWQAFLRIDLPLAVPGVAAAGIFAFLTSWNEFQLANVLARTTASKTFPIGLFDFTSEFTIDWRAMSAMSVLMLIPPIVFVILTQRHLVRGLTLGAVK